MVLNLIAFDTQYSIVDDQVSQEGVHGVHTRPDETRSTFGFFLLRKLHYWVCSYPKITPTIWKTEQKTDFRFRNHHYSDKFCQVIDLYYIITI